MPEAAAPAPAGAPAQGEQSVLGKFSTAIAVFMGVQIVMKFAFPKESTTAVTNEAGQQVSIPRDVPAYALRAKELDEGAEFNPTPQKVAPMWPEDSKVDVLITVSPSFRPNPLDGKEKDQVVFKETGFDLGNSKDKRSFDTTISVPTEVQNNGTLWGHFYVGLPGSVLDIMSPKYDHTTAYHFLFPLTQYIAKKKEAKVHNLLSNKDDAATSDNADDEDDGIPSGTVVTRNYYHPNQTLQFVPKAGTMDWPSQNPALKQFVHLDFSNSRDGSGQHSWYYPILFVNTFWQLKTHMTVLNSTVSTLPLHIDLSNVPYWQFAALATIETNGRENARQAAHGNAVPGGGDGTEIEMIKEIFLDSNPILLVVTGIVSIAHMILEMLAFGSDIAHYRKKKDNVGISVRSILANVFMQTVILLYLVDNAKNTSWMILGSQVVGIFIEFWKITTIVNVRIRDAPPGSLIPKRITFEDKHKLSETEEQTKEYDAVAFRYMYMAGIPLLLAYAAYSLVYESHKSWYSFVITTLVGSVYAYGFLLMVPSLYINYRLKSVAHMPGKAMMYKFLNTFIDDLFAFTIKMPILHRLATFRDDIIFFVYIYQRWAYRIDYTRVNEFGQGGDDEDEAVEVKKAEGQSLPADVVEPVKEIKAAVEKATGSEKKGKATKRK